MRARYPSNWELSTARASAGSTGSVTGLDRDILMAMLDEHVMEIMDNSAADGNVGNADLTKETVDRYYEEFASSFEYVGSGAYRKEPEFQRFLQNKAEHMKGQGEKLELWN